MGQRFVRLLQVVGAGLALASTIPNVSHATVFATDWHAAGDGLITRDTVNGLDWLDLTVTQGLSYDQALALTRPGRAFAGFKIARLDELFGLYGQAVGQVTPASNGNTPVSDFTPDETAAQRQFVDLLGATFTYDYPEFGVRRDAIGVLSKAAGTDDPTHVAGGLFFYFANGSASSYSWFNNDSTLRSNADANVGVYLVRAIDGGGAAVPEAASWAMLLTGFGIVGAGVRARRWFAGAA